MRCSIARAMISLPLCTSPTPNFASGARLFKYIYIYVYIYVYTCIVWTLAGTHRRKRSTAARRQAAENPRKSSNCSSSGAFLEGGPASLQDYVDFPVATTASRCQRASAPAQSVEDCTSNLENFSVAARILNTYQIWVCIA